MTDAAKAVIEEALRAAAYTDDFAPDYARANAAAVLQRVLAALGGEPPVGAWHKAKGYFGSWLPHFTEKPWADEWTALYAHPAPPIDLAAIRAVAEEMRKTGGADDIRWWADRLLRAIGDVKDAEPSPQPARDLKPYRGE